MDYSILYKEGELKASKAIPLYQNENNSNMFKFYFDTESLTEFTPSGMQAVFCYKHSNDNTFSEDIIVLDSVLYKERYVTGSLPIKYVYTKLEGILECYVKFLEVDMFDVNHELPTNHINVRIGRSNYQSSWKGATEEDIEKLQKQINELLVNKAGEFDVEGNTIKVYSDSTKQTLIDTIEIPEEVSYEFGEGNDG